MTLEGRDPHPNFRFKWKRRTERKKNWKHHLRLQRFLIICLVNTHPRLLKNLSDFFLFFKKKKKKKYAFFSLLLILLAIFFIIHFFFFFCFYYHCCYCCSIWLSYVYTLYCCIKYVLWCIWNEWLCVCMIFEPKNNNKTKNVKINKKNMMDGSFCIIRAYISTFLTPFFNSFLISFLLLLLLLFLVLTFIYIYNTIDIVLVCSICSFATSK